jgi:hypothetical protein
MCLWIAGTPRPANHDGCLPVEAEVSAPRRLVHPLAFALPVAVGAVVAGRLSIGASALPSTPVMLGVVVTAMLLVIGVGIGVLRQIDADGIVRPRGQRLIIEPRVTSDAQFQRIYRALNTVAVMHGIDPAPAELLALCPAPSTLQALPAAAADQFVLESVARVLNCEARRQGDTRRITPTAVAQLLSVGV